MIIYLPVSWKTDLGLTMCSFILEGILTVVAASFSYLLVWDEPATATFLTEEEKNVILKALNPIQTEVSMSPQLGSQQSAKWVHIKAALSDWQV
jgi:hypothetical protein